MIDGYQNLPALFQHISDDSPQFLFVYFSHMRLWELIHELKAFGQFEFGNPPLIDQKII